MDLATIIVGAVVAVIATVGAIAYFISRIPRS